ncbi:unnamed protein product [Lactuca virosa]|uniref:Uncharacterized protein n=1 Tax=Lactuca virosa TaxID=75947 RepID=A0AAU9MQ07_9ASTR|nr:unnamed protein product [Lactuca virosa]
MSSDHFAAPPSVSNGALRSMEPDYPEESEYETQAAAPSQVRFVGSSQQFPLVDERTVPIVDFGLPPQQSTLRPFFASNDKLNGKDNPSSAENRGGGGGGATVSGWVRPKNSGNITHNPYSNTLVPASRSSFDARARSNISMRGDKFKHANQQLDLY